MCGSFFGSARGFLLAAITAAVTAVVTAVGVVVFFLLFRFLFVFRLRRLFLFLRTCRLPTFLLYGILARPIITAVYHFMKMYRQCTIDHVGTAAVVYVGTAAVVFDGTVGTAGIAYKGGGS